jgi:hypothetical protein
MGNDHGDDAHGGGHGDVCPNRHQPMLWMKILRSK